MSGQSRVVTEVLTGVQSLQSDPGSPNQVVYCGLIYTKGGTNLPNGSQPKRQKKSIVLSFAQRARPSLPLSLEDSDAAPNNQIRVGLKISHSRNGFSKNNFQKPGLNNQNSLHVPAKKSHQIRSVGWNAGKKTSRGGRVSLFSHSLGSFVVDVQ